MVTVVFSCRTCLLHKVVIWQRTGAWLPIGRFQWLSSCWHCRREHLQTENTFIRALREVFRNSDSHLQVKQGRVKTELGRSRDGLRARGLGHSQAGVVGMPASSDNGWSSLHKLEPSLVMIFVQPHNEDANLTWQSVWYLFSVLKTSCLTFIPVLNIITSTPKLWNRYWKPKTVFTFSGPSSSDSTNGRMPNADVPQDDSPARATMMPASTCSCWSKIGLRTLVAAISTIFTTSRCWEMYGVKVPAKQKKAATLKSRACPRSSGEFSINYEKATPKICHDVTTRWKLSSMYH